MKHRLFLIIATCSAVLCVTTAVLWLRSYRSNSTVVWRSINYDGRLTDWTFVMADSAAGHVCFSPYRHRVEPINWFKLNGPVRQRHTFDWVWDGDRPLWPGFSEPDYWGIQFRHFTDPYTPPQVYEGWAVTLPYWIITPLLGVLPLVAALQFSYQRRRRNVGRCATCGYDLRASPEVCPECGSPVSAVRPAA